jgi:TrmH family RNA methyltransferase
VPEALWLAHASEDILENSQIFPTLREALADKHFVIATTRRGRGLHFPYFTPEELGQKIIPVSQEHKIAIVFGREATGLTNEEIQLCHAISTIPAAASHPSLNLAQAVMLYAYELFKASFEAEKKFQWKLASYEQKEAVYQHLRSSLQNVNFIPMDSWDNFMMRFRRMFDRSLPEVRDANVMHKILQAFDLYIEELRDKKDKG